MVKMIWLEPLNKRTRTECDLGVQLSEKRSSMGLEFFHSLFAWLSLLTAFKYWLDKGDSKSTQLLINGRIYNLDDIQVVGRGKRLSIIADGQRITRGKVNIIGIVHEIEGKLIIDTTGDSYSTLPAGFNGITIDIEDT